MKLNFACKCGQQFNVPLDWAGKKAKCSACQAALIIPSPLPGKSNTRLLERQGNGKNAACPYCRGPVEPLARKCMHCGEWLDTDQAPKAVTYASFVDRFAAFFVDGLVLMLAGIPIVIVAAVIAESSGLPASDSQELGANLMSGLMLLTCWLYYALMESSKHQATLGKLLVKTRVADEQGQPISFGRASGRFFAKFVSVMPMYIGFLFPLFHPKGQALHDLIARCVVTRSKRPKRTPPTSDQQRRCSQSQAALQEMRRPDSVWRAVVLLGISVGAVGPIRAMLRASQTAAELQQLDAPSGVVAIIAVLTMLTVLAILALGIHKLWQGRNWARVTFLVLFILGLPFALPTLLQQFEASIFSGFFGVLQLGLQGVALVMLYLPESNAWFFRASPSAQMNAESR